MGPVFAWAASGGSQALWECAQRLSQLICDGKNFKPIQKRFTERFSVSLWSLEVGWWKILRFFGSKNFKNRRSETDPVLPLSDFRFWNFWTQQNLNIFHRPTSKLQSDAGNLPVNLFWIGWTLFPSQISWERRWAHSQSAWRRSETAHAKVTTHIKIRRLQLRIPGTHFGMLPTWRRGSTRAHGVRTTCMHCILI